MNFLSTQTLLMNILKVLGLFYYRYDSKTEEFTQGFWDIFRNLFLIVTLRIGIFFVRNGSEVYKEYFGSDSNVLSLLYQLSTFGEYLFIITLHLGLLTKRKYQINFFTQLHSTADEFGISRNVKFCVKFRKLTLFLTIGKTVTTILLFTSHIFMHFKSENLNFFVLSLPHMVNLLLIDYTMIFLLNILKYLKLIIKHFNDKLSSCLNSNLKNFDVVMQSYIKVEELIIQFNNGFGFIYFLMYVAIFVDSSFEFYIFIQPFVEQNSLNLHRTFFGIFNISWTVELISLFYAFVSNCESLNREVIF